MSQRDLMLQNVCSHSFWLNYFSCFFWNLILGWPHLWRRNPIALFWLRRCGLLFCRASFLCDIVVLQIAWWILIVFNQGIIVGRNFINVASVVRFLLSASRSRLWHNRRHRFYGQRAYNLRRHRFYWCLSWWIILYLADIDLLLRRRIPSYIVVHWLR